jgi:Protein of unknown function (DUF3618)
MGTQSEQLERKAQQARARLTKTLKELRAGLTPGQVVDQLADYAREGPAAEFFRNLARQIWENPLPLTLIGAGIAWLIIASSQSSRARAKHSTVREVGEISTGTSVEVSASSEDAYAQVEAVRQALMPLPAADFEYPGDSATSSAPSLNEAMRQQTRRQDARAMEQAHEP